jgi:DNA-directed RNA polymerase
MRYDVLWVIWNLNSKLKDILKPEEIKSSWNRAMKANAMKPTTTMEVWKTTTTTMRKNSGTDHPNESGSDTE